jgi:aryl-alcohol dehydrogenase-like predicted oxidoreductase
VADRVTTNVPTRSLGWSGLRVSAVGLGCSRSAARSGATAAARLGRGHDDESERAIRRALELGVTFFDTSDVYGAGNGERCSGAPSLRAATRW